MDKEFWWSKHSEKRKWKKAVGRRLRGQITEEWGERKEHLFAWHLDISQGTLSDICNGVSSPSAETLKKIALRTEIDIRWLLTGIKFK